MMGRLHSLVSVLLAVNRLQVHMNSINLNNDTEFGLQLTSNKLLPRLTRPLSLLKVNQYGSR